MKHLLIISILISFVAIGSGQQFRVDTMSSHVEIIMGERNLVVYDSAANELFYMNDKDSIHIGDTIKLIKQLIKMIYQCQQENNFSHKSKWGITPLNYYYQDSLTASRFIEDSIGNTFEIEYKYVDDSSGKITDTRCKDGHCHYIAIVSIIKFKGNKQQTISQNIKAIYSPTECVADNRELWLKRLYQIQNKK